MIKIIATVETRGSIRLCSRKLDIDYDDIVLEKVQNVSVLNKFARYVEVDYLLRTFGIRRSKRKNSKKQIGTTKKLKRT